MKRIDSLTDAQKAQMKPWADKWIKIGLQTGDIDLPTFTEGIASAYKFANLKWHNNVVVVDNPLIMALSAPIAGFILKSDAVRDAVGGAVSVAVRGAVSDAVGIAVHGAVSGAVDGAVGGAVGAAVGGAVRDAVRDAVGGAVDGAVDGVRDAVDVAVRGAVSDAVRGAVHGAVRGAVRDAVSGAVGGAVDGAVHDAVGGAVSDAVHDAVRGAVRDAVSGAVGGAVRDAVRDAVGGAVSDAVHDAVGVAVRGAVHGAVRVAVGGAVGVAVSDAVRDAVGGAVGVAVRGAVSDAVGGAVSAADNNNKLKKEILDKYYNWLGGQFWVGGWGWGNAYVTFFRDICGLELSDDIHLRMKAYEQINTSACMNYPHNKFVMVSKRPSHINRDDNGRLHSETTSSIAWKGFELHHWHGVSIPAEWIENKASLDAKTALTWPNIEQRRAACELVGWDAILNELSAKTIDHDPNPEHGTLYEVDLPDSPKERFLRVKCATGRNFALRIDRKAKTVLEAQCWVKYRHFDTSKFKYPSLTA